MEVYVMFSLYMLWLHADGVIRVASVLAQCQLPSFLGLLSRTASFLIAYFTSSLRLSIDTTVLRLTVEARNLPFSESCSLCQQTT